MVKNQGAKKRRAERIADSLAKGLPGGAQRLTTRSTRHSLTLEMRITEESAELGRSIIDLLDRPWLRETFDGGEEWYAFTPRHGVDAHYVWPNMGAPARLVGADAHLLTDYELERFSDFMAAVMDAVFESYDVVDSFADSAREAFFEGGSLATSFDENWEDDMPEGEVDEYPDEAPYVSVSLPVPPLPRSPRPDERSFGWGLDRQSSVCADPRCQAELYAPTPGGILDSATGPLVAHVIYPPTDDRLSGTQSPLLRIVDGAPSGLAKRAQAFAHLDALGDSVAEAARTEHLHALVGLPPHAGRRVPTRVQRAGAGMRVATGVQVLDAVEVSLLVPSESLFHTKPVDGILLAAAVTPTFRDGWRYRLQPRFDLDAHLSWSTTGDGGEPRVTLGGTERVGLTSKDLAALRPWVKASASILAQHESKMEALVDDVIRAARSGASSVSMEGPDEDDALFGGFTGEDYMSRRPRMVNVTGIDAVGAEGVLAGERIRDSLRKEYLHALLGLEAPSFVQSMEQRRDAAKRRLEALLVETGALADVDIAPQVSPGADLVQWAPRPTSPHVVLFHPPEEERPPLSAAALRLGGGIGVLPAFRGRVSLDVISWGRAIVSRGDSGLVQHLRVDDHDGWDASEWALFSAWSEQAFEVVERHQEQLLLLRDRVVQAVMTGIPYSTPTDDRERASKRTHTTELPWLRPVIVPECEGHIETRFPGLRDLSSPTTHTWVRPDGTSVLLARQALLGADEDDLPAVDHADLLGDLVETRVQVLTTDMPDDVLATLIAAMTNADSAHSAVMEVEMDFYTQLLGLPDF